MLFHTLILQMNPAKSNTNQFLGISVWFFFFVLHDRILFGKGSHCTVTVPSHLVFSDYFF